MAGRRALLEVCGPRVPCVTFAKHMAERAWVRRFTERGRTGAYLAVREPGVIAARCLGRGRAPTRARAHRADVLPALRWVTGTWRAMFLGAEVLPPVEHALARVAALSRRATELRPYDDRGRLRGVVRPQFWSGGVRGLSRARPPRRRSRARCRSRRSSWVCSDGAVGVEHDDRAGERAGPAAAVAIAMP